MAKSSGYSSVLNLFESSMAKGKYEQWLTEEGLLQIEAWARNGLIDEQIAYMGIAYSTLRIWKDKYLALSAALKRGKEVVDIQVENALDCPAEAYINSYNRQNNIT